MSILPRLFPALLIAPLALAAACAQPPTDSNDRLGNEKPSSGDDQPSAPTKKGGGGGSDATPAPSTAPSPPPAPAADTPPTLTSVDPASVTVGASPQGVDVTLSGTRFPTTGGQVSVAGQLLPAQGMSDTQLKVHLTPDVIKTTGSLAVSVIAKPGVQSNALTFTVANPTSVLITALTPASAVIGATNPVTLKVTGSGFASTSVASFNGAALQTTVTSATALTAQLPSTAFNDAGKIAVTVSTGGSVISLPFMFEIDNPKPVANTAAPASINQGSQATQVTLTGAGFVKGSDVLSGTTVLSTTFVSATQVKATIPSALLASAGSLKLTVQNAAPGGGTSAGATVTVAQSQSSSSGGTGGTGTGGTGTSKPDCAYPCADYGYDPYECYSGWYCIATGTYAGCLTQDDTCTDDTGTGTGTTTGAGGGADDDDNIDSTCNYLCDDYDYNPGDCTGGYYCVKSGLYAGCLQADEFCQ